MNVSREISPAALDWAAAVIAAEHGPVQPGDVVTAGGVDIDTSYGVDSVRYQLAALTDLRAVDLEVTQ